MPAGTPRDAASAPDATILPELIDPTGELVGQPLAIAGSGRRAHASTVNIRKLRCEAGIPSPNSTGPRSTQIGAVFHGRAEAGRADHGAVRTRHAARGHVIPVGILRASGQQLSESFEAQPALLPARHPARQVAGLLDLSPGRPGQFQQIGQSLALVGSHIHQELMPIRADQLGQREVETFSRSRPRSHRIAEAGRRGARAGHGDDHRRRSPLNIEGILDLARSHQRQIQQTDGRQVACADPDKGK